MGWSSFSKKYLDPVKDAALGYNPITMATDLITGGKASEMLGLDKSAYNVGSGLLGDVGEMGDDLRGKTAEEAATKASATTASAMMEQLEYLKEINKLPQELKQEALTKLGTLYGGGEEGQAAQQEIFDQGKTSPMYQAMMAGRGAGEESIARLATRTGGLRSGNTQSALYDYNQQTEQKALMDAYMMNVGGIHGLAGIPTNEQQIGQTMGNIGQVQGQGIMAAAGARQQGTQNMLNLGLGLGGLLTNLI